jgi:sulfate transport system permease protein
MIGGQVMRASAAGGRTLVRAREESPWVRRLWITLAAGCLIVLLLLPLLLVFHEAFRSGAGAWWRAVSDPDTRSAIGLTLMTAAIAVPINVVFGLAASWWIARHRFRGRAAVLTLIDLPFSVSPVVAGLMLVLLFGAHAPWGAWLAEHGIRVLFAPPAIVLATLYVTFPIVARELIPLMESQGAEEETAALCLGASGWQMWSRITLPRIRWGLIYGVILCNARAMGEFGAVSVVSGMIRGQTCTLPLQVEILYNEYQTVAAFSAASLLAGLALVTLGIKEWVHWRARRSREEESAP